MTNSLPLSYPLRPNFMAQVVIPQDLTTVEAKRLAAFLMSIAQPNEKKEIEEKLGGDRP